MNAVTNVIAIDRDDEINRKACGRIVFWSLGGTVSHEALVAALAEQGSQALPPEPPSGLVALHRAVESVARGDVHHKARGEWAIVGKGHVEQSDDATQLAYPIRATARLNGEDLTVEGEGSTQIAAAFVEAKKWLAPSDIGSWLARKVEGLGGVPMRASGGFYFVPKDRVESWSRLTRAIEKVSANRVHAIPAMRTAEAVDAILSAVAEDTKAACEKIAASIPEAGERALESRKEEAAALLARIARYEALLGQKLDTIRNVVEDVQAATACAMLALGGKET